jgi:hypothetical protein
MFEYYLKRTFKHPPLSKIDNNDLIIYSPYIVNAYSYALKLIRYKKRGKMKKMKKQIIEMKKEDFILPTSDVHIEIDFELIQSSMKDKFLTIINHISYLCKTHEHIRNYVILIKNFHLSNDYEIYFNLLDNIPMQKILISKEITNIWEYIKKRKWDYSHIKIPGNSVEPSNISLQRLFVYSIL